MNIDFCVKYRKNSFAPEGVEYALMVCFEKVMDFSKSYCICTWNNEPSEKAVEEAKHLILRAMSIYHKQIRVPSFSANSTKIEFIDEVK